MASIQISELENLESANLQGTDQFIITHKDNGDNISYSVTLDDLWNFFKGKLQAGTQNSPLTLSGYFKLTGTWEFSNTIKGTAQRALWG